MTDHLRAAAQQALAKPRFKTLLRTLTPQERSDPRMLLLALGVAAELDPRGGDTPEYNAAYSALKSLVAAEDLQRRISEAYWSPALRAKYGVEAVERAWHDPATAREILLNESKSGRLAPEADAALTLIYEAEQFVTENGAALPQAAAAPIPSTADGVEQEIRSLLDKSARGHLTPAEDARLTSLYETKAGREDEAERAAEARPQRPKQPGEYDALIAKSIKGELSPAEDARLNQLSGERAVASGLISREDMEAEAEQERSTDE